MIVLRVISSSAALPCVVVGCYGFTNLMQVMFIDFVAHPLFETWADLVDPFAQEIMNELADNREYYAKRVPKR